MFHPNFIGTDVEVGAIAGWNLCEELFEAGLEHLHSLRRSHRETEGVVEVATVTGHVYFGNDGDAPFAGIGYHFAYLVIGIELPFIASLALELRVVELRISSALDAPGRIVGEVPMEDIDLIKGEEVEFALQHLDGTEVAARIVHKASNGKGRPVANGHLRYPPFGIFQLAERGASPNQSLRRLGTQTHRRAFHLKGVAFIGQ